MANYKEHCSFNILLALPLLVATQFYCIHPAPQFLWVFIGTFVYTTLFMNPDLDLAHQIKLFSVRGFFSIPFRAYSKVFKHRGISHSVLLGSLTRVIWLAGFSLLVFYIVYQTIPSPANFMHCAVKYKPFLLYAIAGIWLADICHLLLDLRIRR